MTGSLGPHRRSDEQKRGAAKRLGTYTGVLGLEKNCAQLLLLGANGRSVNRTTASPNHLVVGQMKHQPVVARGTFAGLSSDALVALAFLHTKFVQQGSVDSNRVRFADGELVKAIGRKDAKAEKRTVGVLEELREGAFDGLVAHHGGERRWGTLEALSSFSRAIDGVRHVVLPDLVADNLRHDFAGYMDHGVMLALKREDPLALRLWVLAEAQNLKYGLFARKGLPRCIFAEDSPSKNESLALAELLSLRKRPRSWVIQRVTRAVLAVNSYDPKYAIEVREDRSWVIVFRRRDLGDVYDPSTISSTTLSPSTSIDIPNGASSDIANDLADEHCLARPPPRPLRAQDEGHHETNRTQEEATMNESYLKQEAGLGAQTQATRAHAASIMDSQEVINRFVVIQNLVCETVHALAAQLHPNPAATVYSWVGEAVEGAGGSCEDCPGFFGGCGLFWETPDSPRRSSGATTPDPESGGLPTETSPVPRTHLTLPMDLGGHHASDTYMSATARSVNDDEDGDVLAAERMSS